MWAFLHLIFLITAFGSIIVIDTFGLLYLLNKRTLKEVDAVARITQLLIWLGFFGLVFTGLLLTGGVIPSTGIRSVKMLFVGMLGLNGIFLHTIRQSYQTYLNRKFIELPLSIRIRIFLASAISQIGWWGAIIIGFVSSN
jgi:hypothetical protein